MSRLAHAISIHNIERLSIDQPVELECTHSFVRKLTFHSVDGWSDTITMFGDSAEALNISLDDGLGHVAARKLRNLRIVAKDAADWIREQTGPVPAVDDDWEDGHDVLAALNAAIEDAMR
jgi:hypothetical protein